MLAATFLVAACANEAERRPVAEARTEVRAKTTPTQQPPSIAYESADRAPGSLASSFAFSAIAPDEAQDWNTERYDAIEEEGYRQVVDSPLSTFSIDVDTASYSNVRRFLESGTRPPVGAVRIEELVNYFRYPAAGPVGDEPFATELEIFDAPWAPAHRLVRIALRGRTIPHADLPPRNLVFLVDVSGSMQGADRLELVKQGLSELVATLRPVDRVSLVVYAGASGLVLPPTPGDERGSILAALDRLQAGGSTHGAAGIRLAYDTARAHFDPSGINRVVLATDGDFNVGVTSRSELMRLIEQERESGVFLTVLGVGRGNLNDAGMEELADHGNGFYAYLDSPAEARRVLVERAASSLVTIASDVKIQVEWNPARVGAYRLIGYENRRLADRDFNDDRRDAGEIGPGHHVTALYEVVPAGLESGSEVDPLRYQQPGGLAPAADSGEWLTLKVRYKAPGETRSRLLVDRLTGDAAPIAQTSDNARFSSAVALFGLLLQESDYAGEGSFEMVEALAREALGRDEQGERRERQAFLELVALARRVAS